MSEITPILKYLPVFTFSTITGCIALVYMWSAFGNYVKTFPLPTISETGNLWPMNSIFCFGLNLGSACFFLIVVMKAYYEHEKINIMKNLIKKTKILVLFSPALAHNPILEFLAIDIPCYMCICAQYITTFIGTLSCILLAMVGAINMQRNLTVHNITAAFFFLFAIIYCMMTTVTTIVMKCVQIFIKYGYKILSKKQRKSQDEQSDAEIDNTSSILEEINSISNFAPISIILWRLACSLILAFVLVPIAIFSREMWVNQHLPNWKNGLSIAEYLGVLLISFVFVSFSYDFSLFELKLTMEMNKKNSKNDSNEKAKQLLLKKMMKNENNLYASSPENDNKSVGKNGKNSIVVSEVSEQRSMLGNVQQDVQEDGEEKMGIFNN